MLINTRMVLQGLLYILVSAYMAFMAGYVLWYLYKKHPEIFFEYLDDEEEDEDAEDSAEAIAHG